MFAYKVAVSDMYLDGKLPPEDRRWRILTNSFVNLEMDLDELVTYILGGYSYTTWHKPPRRAENFICGQHIAVDVDSGPHASVQGLLDNWLVRHYAAFVHATFSSRPEAPRSRAVFLLDEPITTAAGYMAAVETIISMIPGADAIPKNAVSFFYGTRNDAEYAIPGFGLPVAFVRELYAVRREQQRRQRPTYTANNGGGARTGNAKEILHRWIDELARATTGNRNDTLNRAAFVCGKLAADGELDANETAGLLAQIASSIGLGKAEIRATIRSAFRASGLSVVV